MSALQTSPVTHSIKDLVARFNVSEIQVLGWIKSGKLRAINIGLGKERPRWRITAEELEHWELSIQAGVTSAPSRKTKRVK